MIGIEEFQERAEQGVIKTFDESMDKLRLAIKEIAHDVNSEKARLMRNTLVEKECIANIILAYRHLEDASMRIGKVKQHLNGGESIYDKNVVGSK